MTMALKKQGTFSANCPFDLTLATVTGLLLLMGFIMVGSASIEVSARTYDNPAYLLLKHGVCVGIGLTIATLTLLIPIKLWHQCDRLCLLASFALLTAVLIPGIGHTVNGSTRWISLGLFTLQGSEFVKLFSIVYIAGHLVRHRDEVHAALFDFIKPVALVLIIVLLLLQQPDFGASVVIMATVMGVVFLSGAPFKHFLPIITLVLVAAFVIVFWQPYRVDRMLTFADPWAHQFNSGYQLTQALIAFGRGEWIGLGLGNSIQKLFFLPEAHTDFLFSIIAEELGIIGAVFIILLFTTLVLRGLWLGHRAQKQGLDFHAYLAYGIALLLGIQAVINIGVNVGLLPTKGLTLPFLSFGGNSIIVSCVLVAILLRIEFELRQWLPKAKSRRGRS